MKLISLSFDDGTIYDSRFIKLLNQYHLKATFNLNSGLGDYVWYDEQNHAIRRPLLQEVQAQYQGHEVASHTLTHPRLTELSQQELIRQIDDDILALRDIFQQPVGSFAVPFDVVTEEILKTIKTKTLAKNVRIPKIDPDAYVPKDPYHLSVNAWYDDPEIYEKLERFADNDLPLSLFLIAGHSYEFEVKDDWEKIEHLLQYLSSHKEFHVVTVKEACEALFPSQQN